MTIIHPEKMPDIVNTMLAIYKEQGKLPVWHLVGNETQSLQKTTALKINIFNQLR
jgi:putative alpha-1,2-mannosidase